MKSGIFNKIAVGFMTIIMMVSLAIGFTACSELPSDGSNGATNNDYQGGYPTKHAPKKTDDGVLKYALSDDKSFYIVKDVIDSDVATVTIPNSLHGVPVKCVGQEAFKDCRKLSSIAIPDSVTNIEESAFDMCRSLTSVVLPKNLMSLGKSSFAYCSGLVSVTLPPNLLSIGDFAFSNCSKLTSITIPKSVIEIGYAAFSECDSLKSVYITDIASWCEITFGIYNANPLEYADNFYINGEYVKEITIPEGVTSIGAHAFSGYANLTSITIPKSVKSIGKNAFKDCTSLKNTYISDLTAWCNVSIDGYDATPLSDGGVLYLDGEIIKDLVIPNNVKSISKYAFYGFTTLNSVTFHNQVNNIGDCAFAHCISLTSVTLPNSVTSVGEYAFYNCYGLKSFTMGKGVSSIGDYAFDKCNSLVNLTYCGRVEQWNLIDKDALWDGVIARLNVNCTDGTIAKNGVVTYN